MTTIQVEIAKQVRDLRKERGLTQKELAEKCGFNTSTIYRLECDGYQGCTVNILWAVARALDAKMTIELITVD